MLHKKAFTTMLVTREKLLEDNKDERMEFDTIQCYISSSKCGEKCILNSSSDVLREFHDKDSDDRVKIQKLLR